MSIQLTCGGCNTRYSVKDELAGKRVKCASCGAALVIPAAGAAPTATSGANEAKPAASQPAKPAQAQFAKPAASPAKAPVASARPVEAAKSSRGDLDSYELDTSPAPAVAESRTPLTSGHRVQPKLQAGDADFELEPPVEVKVATDFFLDVGGDTGSASKAAPSSPARKKGSSHTVSDAARKDAEGLTVAEEVKPPEEPTKPCPSCGAAMKESAVLCVECGLNLKTGEKLEAAPVKKGGFGKLFGRK